jgi:GT2 family glycosyltransferase
MNSNSETSDRPNATEPSSLANLTLATTAHNNAEMSIAMLKSFEEHIGICAEIVVVDDGSGQPFVPPVLKNKVRVVRNDTAQGFCKASDRALREVHTEFGLLVDADVLFQPGDLLTGFAQFCRDPQWAWVSFKQVDFNGNPQGSFETELAPPWVFALGNQWRSLWMKWFQKTPVPDPDHRLIPVTVAHSSSAMVRMAAYKEVGGFDPWYWQCESDIDLSLLFIQHGYKVGIDRGYEVKHEGSGGKTGGFKRTLDLYRARLHLYEKFYPASRFYLRGLLWLRHAVEALVFAIAAIFNQRYREGLPLRLTMLKKVMSGY